MKSPKTGNAYASMKQLEGPMLAAARDAIIAGISMSSFAIMVERMAKDMCHRAKLEAAESGLLRLVP